MFIIHTDNRFDRGQLLRTRRPSYTVTLEEFYPAERIPEFYRNDGINELIGLPHEDVLLTEQTDASQVATRIGECGQDVIVIDHETLRSAFAAFWNHAALGKALTEAVRGGACLWIGFQSAGYAPAWLAKLLPGATPWRVVAAGEAGAVAKPETGHRGKP